MFPNEQSTSSGLSSQGAPRPGSHDQTLKTERLQIERKTFVISLRQNPRGQFLRITEDSSGHRDTIIIPTSGWEEVKTAIEGMIKLAAETPTKSG
jgi:hypothetical protein